jgi:hypothetical protein
MARILLVGNFAQKIPGGFYYNVDHKLRAAFLRLGHVVLDFSDRDQARLGNIFGNRKLGVGAANKKLLETVINFRPDCIVLGHTNIIANQTLSTIRSQFPHIRIGVFNVDSLALASHQSNVRHLLGRADVVDGLFISTAGEMLRQFKRSNNFVAYLPNPIDPAMEDLQNFAHSNLPYDLVFAVGGIDNPNDSRLQIAMSLRAALADVKCQWRGMFDQPAVFGRAYYDMLASAKMGLNFSRPNDAYWYASDRISHLLGCGLLTFTAASTGFQELFSEQEMVFFTSPADLAEKIRYYARDNTARQTVAKAGWEKAHRYFNADLIARYMLELLLDRASDAQNYLWAKEVYA